MNRRLRGRHATLLKDLTTDQACTVTRGSIQSAAFTCRGATFQPQNQPAKLQVMFLPIGRRVSVVLNVKKNQKGNSAL